MNVMDRTVERIDRVEERVTGEDKRVLAYIRSQLTPEGFAKRSEDDVDVSHLIQVANTRLRPYEA